MSIWTQNQGGTVKRGWVYPQRHFPSQTRICVEGFKSGGSYGLHCFTVV